MVASSVRSLGSGLPVLLVALALPAFAHVTLVNPRAVAGGYYKAVFDVPHGCKGSATVKLRIHIPDGVISVKPQPKPGWELDVVEGPYPKSYALHGASISSGVREISWSGRLPDAYFDEFTFMSYLSSELPAGTVVYFPVVQECEKGVSRWIETTTPSASPAPALTIAPKP